jgi:hypothetical protein
MYFGVKGLEHEANYSFPSSAEVRKEVTKWADNFSVLNNK